MENEEEDASSVMAQSLGWLVVLMVVFLCNLCRLLLPSFAVLVAHLVQSASKREEMLRSQLRDMRKELLGISIMDEFARYARLERRVNQASQQLRTAYSFLMARKVVQARTAQLTSIKWIVTISFYILQAVVMIILIWLYYSDPVALLPAKWLSPLEKLVAFPTGIPGGVGITCWLIVCNKITNLIFQPFS
uniref:Guided entry of tail-anchored proteins factor 1 n=1 Tax=Eptatretus burgeri TaxID=7764 RepID=A0A8C4N5T1_EPTBU